MAFLSIVSKSAVMFFITALCLPFVMQLQASGTLVFVFVDVRLIDKFWYLSLVID